MCKLSYVYCFYHEFYIFIGSNWWYWRHKVSVKSRLYFLQGPIQYFVKLLSFFFLPELTFLKMIWIIITAWDKILDFQIQAMFKHWLMLWVLIVDLPILCWHCVKGTYALWGTYVMITGNICMIRPINFLWNPFHRL